MKSADLTIYINSLIGDFSFNKDSSFFLDLLLSPPSRTYILNALLEDASKTLPIAQYSAVK